MVDIHCWKPSLCHKRSTHSSVHPYMLVSIVIDKAVALPKTSLITSRNFSYDFSFIIPLMDHLKSSLSPHNALWSSQS